MRTIFKYDVDKFTNYEISINSNKNILHLIINEDKQYGKYIINQKEHKFNYFNDTLSKITIIVESLASITINIDKKNLIIKQIYVAGHLKYFEKELMNTYNLVKYTDPYLPALFFGILSKQDLDILKNNRSLKIIIWTGGDIYVDKPSIQNRRIVLNNVSEIKKLTKVKHIAISKFIENSLMKVQLPFYKIPFSALDVHDFKPVPKGNSIYIYTSAVRGEKYGEGLYSKVIDKYKNINFIMTTSKESYQYMINKKLKNKYNIKYYDRTELIEKIYPQCFLGLRLTKHDGLAGSVIELGAMGIKSVHNGSSPSSLNYQNIEDIYKHIDNEIKTIGTCDIELSNKVKNFLILDKLFFNTIFFKSK